MGRRTTRKRKSDVFKELKSLLDFKFSKKTRKNLMTAGVCTLFLFAAFVFFYPHPESPREISSPKKMSAPIPKPFIKTKPQPAPAVKKTTPASVPLPRHVIGGAPRIAFVIDDMGNTSLYTDMLEKLGDDVTYAILPNVAHTMLYDRFSQRTGAAVILHLPLESTKGTIPGPGLITSTMPDEHVLDRLRRDLDSVPHRIGVNNHMGSKGTSDPRIMNIVLTELKRRGFFFLDSRTTGGSVAPRVASNLGMPVLLRDEFLDNVDSMPAIRQEIYNLAELARQKGYAIGICHYRPNTLQVLIEEIPKLKAAGYNVVSLREFIK